MKPVILTDELTKYFGAVHAAESVNLRVERGEIYGFLGLNGAGKTTVIRMLLGIMRPTLGKVFLLGKPVGPGITDLWNRVGHLVEVPGAYPELTVSQNLEIFRRLRSVKERSLVDKTVEQLNLIPYLHTRAKNLSLGNLQRLGLAKALFHHPELLVLDEPANGLDPAGIVQIRDILTDMSKNHGVTVFVSSHLLGEISRIATRIGIIHLGKMIREADAGELKKERYRALLVDTLDNVKALRLLQSGGHSPKESEDGAIELTSAEALDHPERISEMLAAHSCPPTRISQVEEDLEHFFFRMTQNQPQ